MRVLGIIPARLGSTRLPNKPLQLLAGEPLITRVVERVLDHDLVDELVVATDPNRVKVVTDAHGRALYFSRSIIPHQRETGGESTHLYWQHVGVYAYTRNA